MALAERQLGTLAVPPERLRRGMLHLFQVPRHRLWAIPCPYKFVGL